MKIALCFRFLFNFLTNKLSRGAISSKLREKFKGLKEIRRIHKGYFFTTVINSHFRPLFRQALKPQQQKQKQE